MVTNGPVRGACAVESGGRDGPAERGPQDPGDGDAGQDGGRGRRAGAGDDRPGGGACGARPRCDGLSVGAVRQEAEGLAGQAGGGGCRPRRRRPTARCRPGSAGCSIAEKVRQLGDPPGGRGQPGRGERGGGQRADGLAEGAGDAFGPRRVVVLFCDSLGGGLPAGELTGDDVIVVTSYLPTAADASAAQAALLEAGAAQAAVVGPSVTPGQLARAGVGGTGGWRRDRLGLEGRCCSATAATRCRRTAVGTLGAAAAAAEGAGGDGGDQRVRVDAGDGGGQLSAVVRASHCGGRLFRRLTGSRRRR